MEKVEAASHAGEAARLTHCPNDLVKLLNKEDKWMQFFPDAELLV